MIDNTPMRLSLPLETQCMKGGKSFPLYFDLSNSLPAESLKILVTKTGSGSGIAAESGEITITKTKPRGSITFKCESTATLTTFNIKLSQSGNSFTLASNSLSVNPLNPQTGTQTSKVSGAQKDDGLWNPTVTCSDYANIYWWVGHT